MGLEILSPEPGDAQPDPFIVDIVAVHGLNGDPTNTWKHSATNHFWLQDSLPLDVKGARVLNYGYNADVVFGNTTADVWDHANGLLGSLIDERETDDESKRPIIFIAHSLGGIIVKQALVWAHRDPRYITIKEHTLGIVFFGTPHRGSDKANYGKILADVATGIMHNPKPKLISALRSNSESLMRLTSEFKFEAPNIEIMTFYETKPISLFSRLIVEKQSALMEFSHEDAQLVDANHRDMCKFDTRDHETYKKLVKRLNRMLKDENKSLLAPDCPIPKFRNKHFELLFDVSPYFTGGHDLRHELRNNCLPSVNSSAHNPQRRFILYGLGGSGKTQMALKFASDHRESFWGVFFIDISSVSMAEQGFSTMARICKVGERMDDFKRYLTNSLEPWLLILDNADHPSLDVSQFFPVGNRGTIIVTSRNPECRCHATIGSRELREMDSDEAINLLLRSGDLACEDQNLRRLALPIVQNLGYLALAVNHAGASIRQKICSLEDYLDVYTRSRKKLLSSQPVQAGSEYKYTVYTTWDISVESIKELAGDAKEGTAAKALELLKFFGFCHFDDITEDIFRSAWDNFARTEGCPWWASNILGVVRDNRLSDWDSLLFHEAVQLLSSYSLIHVSGRNTRISLHPLVHSWIRDSLSKEEHLRWWNITLSTLALSPKPREPFYQQRQIKAHLRHCIGTGQIDDLFSDDQVAFETVKIARWIIDAHFCHPWKDGLTISERALEYSRQMLGDECYSTCELVYKLARIYGGLSRHQNALDLLLVQLGVTIRVAGPPDPLTLRMRNELALVYRGLGRVQAALELAQENLAICERSPDGRDGTYPTALENVAMGYGDMGRYEESIDLLEKAVVERENTSNEGYVLHSENLLAFAYRKSGRYQDALDLFQSILEKNSRISGEDHPGTLNTTVFIAYNFGVMSQPEKGIPFMIKALDVGSRIGLDIERLQKYEIVLRRLQSKCPNPPTTVPERLPKSQEPPHPEREEPPSKNSWRFWPKSRR